MLKKLFGKKEIDSLIILKSPITGKIVPLEEVPDPVFAQKMMGDGIAIEPTAGEVVSPINGKVIQVFPTKHAIGLKADNGLEVLLHVGLETVGLNGEGFLCHVEGGSKVGVGDLLLTVDLGIIQSKAKSTITPIILTNSDQITLLEQLTNENDHVEKGKSDLLQITVKKG